jgi:hypothetical protein
VELNWITLRLLPYMRRPDGPPSEDWNAEDIVRGLDDLGVLPMIAARYEQSCLTLGPQSDERRQLPGRTENRRKLAAESSKEQR